MCVAEARHNASGGKSPVPDAREQIVDDVKATLDRYGYCVASVSEGIVDENGEAYAMPSGKVDAFGHEVKLGVIETVASVVEEAVRIRPRFDKPAYMQRSFAEMQSQVDREEAYQSGREGVRAAVAGASGKMIAFERLAGRVRGLAAVHGLLAGDNWQTVSLAKLLPQVIGTVARAVPRDKTLDVLYDCEEVPVTADQARAVALIANELATNVAKHALPERSDVHVRVRVRAARGRVRLCVRDDGPGCNPAALQGEGMQLVRDLVRSELHGRLCARNQDGLIVTIIFPLTRQRYRKDDDAQS